MKQAEAKATLENLLSEVKKVRVHLSVTEGWGRDAWWHLSRAESALDDAIARCAPPVEEAQP